MLYEKAVQLLSRYRSIAARMSSARPSAQGKFDKRLERLSEQISETLGELTASELLALDCWQDSSTGVGYEVDHDVLMQKPYVSIRKVERVDDNQDIDDDSYEVGDTSNDEHIKAQLDKFLNMHKHFD